MRDPIFVLGRVETLSAISRETCFKSFEDVGSIAILSNADSVVSVVKRQTVTDLVNPKRSSCRTRTGRPLPA